MKKDGLSGDNNVLKKSFVQLAFNMKSSIYNKYLSGCTMNGTKDTSQAEDRYSIQHIINAANAYGSLKNSGISSLKKASVENTIHKKSGNYLIIGPITATFQDKATTLGAGHITERLAGEYGSQVGGMTSNGSNWYFCNKSGTKITPKSGSQFYIKVDMGAGLIKGDEKQGSATLVFKTRRLAIDAEWIDWETRARNTV